MVFFVTITIIGNRFSMKAISEYLLGGFSYTNPYITIGTVDSGSVDVNTGYISYSVEFYCNQEVALKNITVINTNLMSALTTSTASNSGNNFSCVVQGMESEPSIYSSQQKGRVLVIAEIFK